MTNETLALKLYVQTLPDPVDLDDGARENEIREWEGRIQLKVELARLVNMGPSDWSRRWAAEFRAREGFIRFAYRREWLVFCRLVDGDIAGALDEIAGQWRASGRESNPDKLLG